MGGDDTLAARCPRPRPAHRALRLAPSLLATCLAIVAPDSGAFTFRDGSVVQCIARGVAVEEVVPPPGDPFYQPPRTGQAVRAGERYRILWNAQRLRALPDEVHDFIFFHECAHARLATDNELEANCAGLQDMRAAGRAGPAVEEKIRALFGPANAFWAETFACADRAGTRPPAAKPAG
jgi:hypothetical protein